MMRTVWRRLTAAALALTAMMFATSAAAECGGGQQCIAVSVDAAAPAHGTPLISDPIAFGSQGIGTNSSPRTITVGAVTGPAGTFATLDSITIAGVDASQFSLAGGTCVTGVPSLLHDGPTCSVLVSFDPLSAGAKNARVLISSAAITRAVPLTGTGVLLAPVITSVLSATGSVGQPFSGYQIQATNNPTSFAAAPLPAGLTINASGLISGTPTSTQVVNTLITATNAAGSGTETLVITISTSVPIITSPQTASGTTGALFAGYQITATNNPTSFNATELPPGLSVDTTTGLISGTPTAGGTFNATVTATNAVATASQLVTFSISAVAPSSQNASVMVALNTPTAIDLAPFIMGVGALEIRIVTPAEHGGVIVDGTVATYVPVKDYFGPDAFSYVAVATDGESQPSIVSLEVVGRPDPSANATTRSLVRSQMEIAKRFSRSQISNFQRRMENLHGRGADRAANRQVGQRLNAPGTPERAPGESKEGPARTDFSLDRGLSSDKLSVLFADIILPALTSGSINLSNDFGGNKWGLPGTGIWVGGNVNFGTRDATDGASDLRFTTDGVSMGVDRWFTDKFVLGVGFGYAHDNTEIGSDGSEVDADAWSVTGYGSYQPVANVFIDGLLGYGDLDYDVERHVAAVDAFAFSDRDGDQLFGSVTLGYEYRKERLLISPYGRFEFAFSSLDNATEIGAGQNALTYFDDSLDTGQLALGLRIESAHEMRFGWVIPRFRMEYHHDFEGSRRSSLAYADQTSGPRFALVSDHVDSDSLLVSIGSDFDFGNGVTLGFDYESVEYSGADDEQSIGLWLSRDFDAAPLNWSEFGRRLFGNPIRVEAAYAYEDNLNRVHSGREKISDNVFNISVRQRYTFPLASHVRLLIDPALSGRKMHENDGLDRGSASITGELQYRTSGDYYAPTFGVFARVAGEDYKSDLRDGYRYSYGVKAQRALTDRIGAFAAVERNVREGDDEVFQTKDYAIRLTFDYSLGRRGTIYTGGEFRRGDTVSSFDSSNVFYEDLADATVIEDAYYNATLEAARFDAKTWMFNLGYNLPIGSRDSVDISWRRIESEARVPGSLSDHLHGFEDNYAANQLFVAYLMRF